MSYGFNEQIDHWASHGQKKAMKKNNKKRMRLEGKKKLDEAPKKRRYMGYTS